MWSSEQLQNVTSLRTDEHNTWVIFFSTCLVTTAILLIALFNSGSLPDKNVGFIICLFGSIMSFVFLIIQNRALATMKTWEIAITEIEKELKLNSTSSFQKPPKSKFLSGRILTTYITLIQIIGWIVGVIYFINF